jgi:hypothetical protein
VGGSWTLLADKVGQATKLDYGTTIMTHRIAHLADKAHFVSHTLARINRPSFSAWSGAGFSPAFFARLPMTSAGLLPSGKHENRSPFRSVSGA